MEIGEGSQLWRGNGPQKGSLLNYEEEDLQFLRKYVLVIGLERAAEYLSQKYQKSIGARTVKELCKRQKIPYNQKKRNLDAPIALVVKGDLIEKEAKLAVALEKQYYNKDKKEQ